MNYNNLLMFAACFFCTTSQAQIINTIAGNGIMGYAGDSGMAVASELNHPWAVCVDPWGNIFIADGNNSVIRKVDTLGIITTVAGNGSYGYSGDGGLAVSAQLNNPAGVVVDSFGNIYIADNSNDVVRLVNNAGTISTYAGNGTFGYSGDGGLAVLAQFNTPKGLALDKEGNLYIADAGNYVVRKVTITGEISTYAGTGFSGYSGDGGLAINANLSFLVGIATDRNDNLYIADELNGVIREVDISGIISTVAGNGTWGYSGDGGPATAAQLGNPKGVAIDAVGNVYIAEVANNIIREVSASGLISTYAGDDTAGFSGDGGPASTAKLNDPEIMGIDAFGNLYLTDVGNSRIRMISPGSTGISSINLTTTKIQLFPSPNTGSFTLKGQFVNGSPQASIEIINLIGQAVYKDDAALQNGSLNKNIALDVPDGLYLLRVNTGQDNEVVRFTIQRK